MCKSSSQVDCSMYLIAIWSIRNLHTGRYFARNFVNLALKLIAACNRYFGQLEIFTQTDILQEIL